MCIGEDPDVPSQWKCTGPMRGHNRITTSCLDVGATYVNKPCCVQRAEGSERVIYNRCWNINWVGHMC